MNKFLSLALLLAPAALFAQQSDESIVHWERIVGVITAPNVDNPVAGINAGAGPWTTRNGHARIDLLTGRASFDVEGLVLVGGNASGTPGPVTTLNGTLVCNAGTRNQEIIDTAEVKLSSEGNAHFRGQLDGLPPACLSPLFLVRIGPSLPAATGRWLGTGAARVFGDRD
ncbi:MAG TPA: hypothetical protein VGN99_05225 [Steroidobacteraceae bacterium]|jgi:hypothetical protein|nr:hypothetical protein [Steroidobacteraceae bacterium]